VVGGGRSERERKNCGRCVQRGEAEDEKREERTWRRKGEERFVQGCGEIEDAGVFWSVYMS